MTSWRVKKRDGRVEKYDESKIAAGIFAAAKRVKGKNKKLAEQLAAKTTEYLKKTSSGREVLSISMIGDAVEKVLIEEGHARTAKIFILYREERRRENKKLVDIKDIDKLRQFLKLTGKKIAFVTGVYDLIHIGHARYLRRASIEGDILVVGLNSDQSTKKLKGEYRPILDERSRAEMLSYFDFVDFIIIFPQTHAANIINILRPDVYIMVEGSWKGNLEKKPEVKAARKYRGEVVILPPQSPFISSTSIIDSTVKSEFKKIFKKYL